MTRPPSTAVRRVDLRRQKEIVIGEINSEIERERLPRKPEIMLLKIDMGELVNFLYFGIFNNTNNSGIFSD